MDACDLRRRRAALAIGGMLIVSAIIGCALWLLGPQVYYAPGTRVTCQRGGDAGRITFLVQNADGLPMPGVEVESDSYSGWGPDAITDAAGKAVIRPGESEVTAVRVGDREIRFEGANDSLIGSTFGVFSDIIFLPSCTNGLLVKVELNSQ